MSKNKKLILKVTTLLMAYAIIPHNNICLGLVGEPQLPGKMKKDDTMMD